MAALTIQIASENDALAEAPAEEVAAMLERAASRIREGYQEGRLLDTNGNTAGFFTFNPEASS